MIICEYCGRVHQTQVPDYRFCSVYCRQQHKRFLEVEGYKPDGSPTFLDYAMTEADYLSRHLVSIAHRAASLVPETDEEDEELSRKQVEFIEGLAQGNSTAERIDRLTNPSMLIPPSLKRKES